jgi:hypothetical protein
LRYDSREEDPGGVPRARMTVLPILAERRHLSMRRWMKLVSLSSMHTMTLWGKGYLCHFGSAGFPTVACVLFPSESILFPQKSFWNCFWSSLEEPIVDSRMVGGCHRDPVGIRSGIRARGSVQAWPVIFQALHSPRAMAQGRVRTGEADARETRSGEKVRRRAACRAA